MNVAFSLARCTGSLQRGSDVCQVSFDLNLAVTGQVTLALDPISMTPATIWLYVHNLGPLTLQSAGPDGTNITSDAVFVASIVGGAAGVAFQPTCHAYDVTISYRALPPTATDLLITYRPIGLQGFASQRAATPLGQLTIRSGLEERHNELYGLVQLLVTAANDTTATIHASDTLVDDVLDILSLAQGHHCPWTAREVSLAGDSATQLYLRGLIHDDRPHQAVFHPLDLQPVLDLAVAYHQEQTKTDDGLRASIAWLLMPHRYLETRLQAALTGLEHLTARHEQAVTRKGLYLPAKRYEKVIKRLKKAIDELRGTEDFPSAEDGDALDRIREKLSELNLVTLSNRLKALFEAWGVPVDDLIGHLPAIIRARNHITHRGEYTETEPPLASLVLQARELLVRTILARLRFSGRYSSYLSGKEEWTAFPPSASANAPPSNVPPSDKTNNARGKSEVQ